MLLNFQYFNNRNKRRYLKISAFVLSLALLVIFTISLRPASDDLLIEKVDFVVERGSGLNTIANDLRENNLIKSALSFKIFGLLAARAQELKPGFYKISSTWNSAQILDVLVAGPADTVIAIREGETLLDIDKSLSEAGIILEGELANFNWRYLKDDYPFLREAESLEGFLFPDTYKFSQFSPVDLVVRELLDNFYKKAWPELSKSEDYYSNLIKASLIEKEAPFSYDRRLISGIIKKRLASDMRLQIDAAIAYAKCGRRFFSCDNETRNLSRDDLAIETPFNTYLYKGLPMAPIANPGLDALRAALNPVSSDYLFYISDPLTKKTIFAKTLDEHNTNRVKYLRR